MTDDYDNLTDEELMEQVYQSQRRLQQMDLVRGARDVIYSVINEKERKVLEYMAFMSIFEGKTLTRYDALVHLGYLPDAKGLHYGVPNSQ